MTKLRPPNRRTILALSLAGLFAAWSACAAFSAAQANRAGGRSPARAKGRAGGADEIGAPGYFRAEPPDRPILFQPLLLWQNGDSTFQGTGFFARAPGGKVAAVSSAHFLSADGPPLMEARWLDVRTSRPVASFTRSWGEPGDGGTNQPQLDLRTDYLLMPVNAAADGGAAEAKAAAAAALDLDPREKPALGEKVWLPDKDPGAKLGFNLLQGAVVETDVKYTLVQMDKVLELQSQSGSPLISQRTGKVIGTLSRGGTRKGTTYLLVAPASALVKALADAKDFPQLRHVIGKRARERQKVEGTAK